MESGHSQSRRGIGREQHVQHLLHRRRALHRGDGVDAGQRPVARKLVARGSVHPRIHEHDEERGRGPAHCHDHARRQVGATRDTLPPVQVHAEEDRLEKEGEALERERNPDDRPGEPHETGPQQAELEREHRSRDRTDREEDGRSLRPPVRQLQEHAVASAVPTPFRDHHHQRHRDADLRKDDVEAQRQRHLRTCGEQVGHAVGRSGGRQRAQGWAREISGWATIAAIRKSLAGGRARLPVSPLRPYISAMTQPPDDAPDTGRFRRTLVRVMSVQVVTLLLLWLLQHRYSR